MKELSKEERIGLCVYMHNEINKPIYFSRLVTLFKDKDISKSDINTIDNKFSSILLTDLNWMQFEGMWIREWRITTPYDIYFKKLKESLSENRLKEFKEMLEVL
jgi:hypothetical protein